MNRYKVLLRDTVYIERIVSAKDEVEARKKALDEESGEYEENTVETDPYWQVASIVKLCPKCDIELEPKMIDVDGTNLEEHLVCPECGHGSPALR